jgi:hypothetical protein
LNEKVAVTSTKPRLKAAGTRCTIHATTLYFQKLPLTSSTRGGSRTVSFACGLIDGSLVSLFSFYNMSFAYIHACSRDTCIRHTIAHTEILIMSDLEILRLRKYNLTYQEECRLLICDAVWLVHQPTFRRNVSPISSVRKNQRAWNEVSSNPPKRRLLQEIHGVTLQKTAFFIVAAVKTSNLT